MIRIQTRPRRRKTASEALFNQYTDLVDKRRTERNAKKDMARLKSLSFWISKE